MYRRLGYFPTESSEHSAEYLPWYMRDPEAVERLRLVEGEYIQRSEENLAEYERARSRLANGEPFAIERSLEYASLIVHSMVTGDERVIYGNVQNAGLLADLPARSAVEVPCVVDRTGVRPTPVADYPPQLAALNRTFLNVADLTVRAALEGDERHVHHAALLDPNAASSLSPEAIEAVVDELLDAHAERLPAGLRR
jgi:alpha-galactosidase